MNKEGLTWKEWLCASGYAIFDRYGVRTKVSLYDKKLRTAWKNGEDPTEWMAEKCLKK